MSYDFIFFSTLYFIFGFTFSSIRMFLSIPKLTEVKKSIFFQGGFSILFWIGIVLGFVMEVFLWPGTFTKVLISGKIISSNSGDLEDE